MTSHFKLECGTPLEGEPQYCAGCPLAGIDTGDFLDAVNVVDALQFVRVDSTKPLTEVDRHLAGNIAVEFGVKRTTVDPALEALSRHLGGICTVKEWRINGKDI